MANDLGDVQPRVGAGFHRRLLADGGEPGAKRSLVLPPPNLPAEEEEEEEGGGKVVQGVPRDTWTSAPQKSTLIFHDASGTRQGGAT